MNVWLMTLFTVRGVAGMCSVEEASCDESSFNGDDMERALAASCMAATPQHDWYPEHIEYVEILASCQSDGKYKIIETCGDGSCGWQSLAASFLASQGVYTFDISILKRQGLRLKKEVSAIGGILAARGVMMWV